MPMIPHLKAYGLSLLGKRFEDGWTSQQAARGGPEARTGVGAGDTSLVCGTGCTGGRSRTAGWCAVCSRPRARDVLCWPQEGPVGGRAAPPCRRNPSTSASWERSMDGRTEEGLLGGGILQGRGMESGLQGLIKVTDCSKACVESKVKKIGLEEPWIAERVLDRRFQDCGV